MLYYRYRSGNELTMKELIYDEMFFAASEECNDPYEGKLFAEFPADEKKWENLINVVAQDISSDLKKRVATYFLEKSPISVGEVLKIDKEEFFSVAKQPQDFLFLNFLLLNLKEYIGKYMPSEKYFVCFTREPDNYLMWSHYANNHKGFCLIFRPLEGKIRQNPQKKRTYISFTTPKAFSPKMSFAIEEDFRIKDVEYTETPPVIDAFMGFPQAVNGNCYGKDELEKFRSEYDNAYYCKHSVWDYEKEARILLSSGIPWLAGERLPISVHKRLFYYDSTQLVGIIFGARMPECQKERIREIVTEKINNWYDASKEKKVISNFVIFEEQLSELKREIVIEPIEIYGADVSKKGQKDFEKKYNDWKEGYAIQFEDSRAKKIRVQ